ncbi:MAG: Strictosidine synthase family protein [Myxococcaceae bacterium]|nr:Strictosidine synthase family protein [Myxococcaceae bacterium]
MKPPIAPVVWTPPEVDARIRHRTALPQLERIDLPACGEDVLVDAEGRLITGLADGRVLRIDRKRGTSETLVDTGGRPMCIEHDGRGALVICDASRGLLRFDLQARRLEVLVDARQHGLGLCNNAAVARDGSIYFSDSSQRFPLEHWRGDLLEHSGTGRLLKRAPDGQLEVLLDGLHFANGVALAADESFVAIAETGAYRVHRVWLQGTEQGRRDMLIDRLPGFPDNMASGPDGLIWIALASRRNLLLDLLHRTPPVLRRLVWALPQAIQPKPHRGIRLLAVDDQGAIVHDIAGKSAVFHMATGVRVFDNTLYLASVEEPALAAASLG